MPTLVDFLLARVAEDEADVAAGVYAGDVHFRILAECEAKRRVVEYVHGYFPRTGIDHFIVQSLALPYADHPDYRDEWSSDA